jgi:uncharacterized protein VirK/YbjX
VLQIAHPLRTLTGALQARSARLKIAGDDRFDWKAVVKTASFLALHPKVSRQWLGFMQAPVRAKLWIHHPRLLDKVLRPYLNAKWGPQERVNALISHYSWLRNKFTRFAIHQIYLDAPITLASCNTRSEADLLTLRLSYEGSFEREGDLTLSLYRQATELTMGPPELVVAITLSVVFIEGHQALCIGCLQARHDVRTMENLKQITKDMHGLRPKTLLIEMVKLLARRWKLALYGIDPSFHPFTSLRYRLSQRKRQAVEMMSEGYVTLWAEHGGNQIAGGWYSLPLDTSARPLSEIPSHKRSMYKKRFDMMVDIESRMQASLGALERKGSS